MKKLEERANELFGENSLVSVAEIKLGNSGYMVRIKMQGMPFEISAIQDTLEEAEEMACSEFEKREAEALGQKLFGTQLVGKYKKIKLTDEQFNRLFKYEDLLDEEYTNELKEKTFARICNLDDGRCECVIESPYMCLHARGSSGVEKLAILSATMTAHDVFRTPLIRVGKKAWQR